MLNQWSATVAMMMGIPGFFEPRYSPALLMGGAAPLLSYYDTTRLKATLERLVDFDRINAREMRSRVGAVNVRTGNSVYFDNMRQKIGPEHVMASGALPPGFPPVEIDGEHYWDGGIVSNTPLQYVLDDTCAASRWWCCRSTCSTPAGRCRATLADVMARQKDIQYSSRTRVSTDASAASANLQQALADLLARLPPELRDDAGRGQPARAPEARADRHRAPDLPQQALRTRVQGLRVLARHGARALGGRRARHAQHLGAPGVAARRDAGQRRHDLRPDRPGKRVSAAHETAVRTAHRHQASTLPDQQGVP